MNTSGSVLKYAIDHMTILLEQAKFDGKLSDNVVLSHYIAPAMSEVLGRVMLTQDALILIRYTITLDGSSYYKLPINAQEIVAIELRGSESVATERGVDFAPRTIWNPCGRGWSIEGNTLLVEPALETGYLDLYYTPSGDFCPHYSTTGGSLDANKTDFTLSTSPTLGYYDKREGAFVGQVLRLLPVGGTQYEERIVASQAGNVVSVRTPFTLAAGSMAYEVATLGSFPLWKAIACSAAFEYAVATGRTEKTQRGLLIARDSAIKTVRDRLSNYNARAGKKFEGYTPDALSEA